MEKPTLETSFRHRTEVQLRFSDVDSFGHVNNSVYFTLYDMAKTEYLHKVLPFDFMGQAIIPVVANINANFLTPIYYGDAIAIDTAVMHVGRKSFTLCQRAVNTETDEVVCQCQTVMVCVAKADGVTVEVPADVREAFERYETGQE